MNNELKNNAVELSDEEMDKIAGGKAIVISEDDRTRVVFTCEGQGIKARVFFQHYKYTNTCPRFSKLKDLPPYNVATYQDCRDCEHFGYKDVTSEFNQKDASSYKQSGYDFLLIN